MMTSIQMNEYCCNRAHFVCAILISIAIAMAMNYKTIHREDGMKLNNVTEDFLKSNLHSSAGSPAPLSIPTSPLHLVREPRKQIFVARKPCAQPSCGLSKWLIPFYAYPLG